MMWLNINLEFFSKFSIFYKLLIHKRKFQVIYDLKNKLGDKYCQLFYVFKCGMTPLMLFEVIVDLNHWYIY